MNEIRNENLIISFHFEKVKYRQCFKLRSTEDPENPHHNVIRNLYTSTVSLTKKLNCTN